MKHIILLIVLMNIGLAFSQPIETVRSAFLIANQNKTNYENFAKLVLPISNKKNLRMQAYQGVAIMMKSNYILNPFSKLSNFYKGKEILEKAILNEPNNIENRFLRYTVQIHCPSIVRYKSNLESDKKFIFENLSKQSDLDLVLKIKTYFNHTKNQN